MQQTESAATNGALGYLEVFQYLGDPHAPTPTNWEGWAGSSEGAAATDGPAAHDHGKVAVEGSLRAEFEKRLADETRRSFEAGRERGRTEGRQAEHDAEAAAHSAADGRRVRQAAELVESLTQERDRYFRAVEHEVVALALAVAARILRREAQMDPLLLTGAVRVALGQLSASTQVRLRVPAAELDLWTEAIALLPNLAVKPAVMAGDEMRLGDCVIETELGSVDLGIRSQLGEIESGFFDRAGGRRPGSAGAADEAGSAVRELRP